MAKSKIEKLTEELETITTRAKEIKAELKQLKSSSKTTAVKKEKPKTQEVIIYCKSINPNQFAKDCIAVYNPKPGKKDINGVSAIPVKDLQKNSKGIYCKGKDVVKEYQKGSDEYKADLKSFKKFGKENFEVIVINSDELEDMIKTMKKKVNR